MWDAAATSPPALSLSFLFSSICDRERFRSFIRTHRIHTLFFALCTLRCLAFAFPFLFHIAIVDIFYSPSVELRVPIELGEIVADGDTGEGIECSEDGI